MVLGMRVGYPKSETVPVDQEVCGKSLCDIATVEGVPNWDNRETRSAKRSIVLTISLLREGATTRTLFQRFAEECIHPCA